MDSGDKSDRKVDLAMKLITEGCALLGWEIAVPQGNLVGHLIIGNPTKTKNLAKLLNLSLGQQYEIFNENKGDFDEV